ncbi:5'-nucleotidase [Staphylococcus carnosus]|uniref:YjjG family noncanonical pyrimidine nucleotidase n=1 Tax=Staphylococcus carnosus TaxID=1281 RepID=UPI0006ABD11E|nr:YjjG family noncanonical pyrimidine nucleotidase [Staphylococcus carnosus]KOR13921.1 5'-nucleotidase [Staphylococcus carnosus]
MTYDTILLDFDDTIVDFHDAEDQAFYHLAELYGIDPTIENLNLFKKVNQAHWEAFQENKLTKEEVLSERFVNYFNRFGQTVNGGEADIIFRDGLATAPVKYFPNTLETIQYLAQNAKVYIVTNGVADTQLRRLAQTPLKETIHEIFISEVTGYQKPMPEFFDYVFDRIDAKREKTLIIGDSLTSDIQGGINAGIDTCWFNFRNKKNETTIQPKFEIKQLNEVKDLL